MILKSKMILAAGMAAVVMSGTAMAALTTVNTGFTSLSADFTFTWGAHGTSTLEGRELAGGLFKFIDYNSNTEAARAIGSGTAISALGEGVSVGPASTLANSGAVALDGNFTAGPKYIGVKIDASGGDFVYGWIKLDNFTGNSPAVNSLTIVSYAFQDSLNTPITTGLEVPEPAETAFGFALLAAVVIGVRRWQSSKKN